MRLTAPTNRPVCRIGFVGTGGVATRHAHVLSTFDDVALVAATDVDPSRAAGVRRGVRHGDRRRRRRAARARPHAVYVCVPPFAHGPRLREARWPRPGCAVFVEKPLAVDLDTAEAVGATCPRAGVLTRVGHHWRCAEPIARARELLAGRRRAWSARRGWTRCRRWRGGRDRARSGGPVVEQAVHVLDLSACWSARSSRCTRVRRGARRRSAATPTRHRRRAAFRRRRRRHAGTTCVLGWKHRAGIEVVADGLVVGVGEDWLEVHDADGTAARHVRPEAARVAADRAFVDARPRRRRRPAPVRRGAAHPPLATRGGRSAPHRRPAVATGDRHRCGGRAGGVTPSGTGRGRRAAPAGRHRRRPPPRAARPVRCGRGSPGCLGRHRAELPHGHQPGADLSFDPELGLFRPAPGRRLPGGAAGLHGGRQGRRRAATPARRRAAWSR